MSYSNLFASTPISGASKPGFIFAVTATPFGAGEAATPGQPPSGPASLLTITEDRLLVAQENAARAAVIPTAETAVTTALRQLHVLSTSATELLQHHGGGTAKLTTGHDDRWYGIQVHTLDLPATAGATLSSFPASPALALAGHAG